MLNSLFTHENADKFQIEISFIEVYNDQAFDLLSSDQQKPFFEKGIVKQFFFQTFFHANKFVIYTQLNQEK